MLRQRYGWMVHISGCLVLHEIGLIALIHPHFIRLLWDLQTVQNVQGCAWSKHGMGESSFCVKNCQKVTLMQIFGRESHLKKDKLPNFSHLMFFGQQVCLLLQTEKSLQAWVCRHIYWSCTKESSKIEICLVRLPHTVLTPSNWK